ncbi:MAG: ATP-binding protein [Lachnospiraceae bacterium]|nr:ATP-binding protein [Lachnospiraceae bacterium]
MSIKSEVYREIKNSYQKTRDAEKEKRLLRLKEVYKKCPEIEDLDNELSMTGVSLSKLVLENPGNKAEILNCLKSNTENISERRARLLEGLGLSRDYTELKYVCAKCKDTGYIGDSPCSCMKIKLAEKLYENSNLASFDNNSFDTFNLLYYSTEVYRDEKITPRENIQRVLKSCLDFSNKFGLEFKNLLLYGNTGLGKTFLCNCIAKELLKEGYSVIYVTSPELFKNIEKERFNKEVDEEMGYYLENLKDCDLLIIDDLGSEFSNSLTASALFEILNIRLIAAKPVIISTNLKPVEIVDQYSDRVVSRILGSYTLLKFFGEDIRVLKKFGNQVKKP